MKNKKYNKRGRSRRKNNNSFGRRMFAILSIAFVAFTVAYVFTKVNCSAFAISNNSTIIAEAPTEEETVAAIYSHRDYSILDKRDGEYIIVPTDRISEIENGSYTFDDVYVRKTPSEDGEILTLLSKGTPVSILNVREDGWSEIVIDDSIYYVNSYYVGDSTKEQEFIVAEAAKDRTPYNDELVNKWGFSKDLQKYLWDSVSAYTSDRGTQEKYYCFLLGVMQHESSLGHNLSHYNSNGTRDLGIMQVNSSNWGKLKSAGIVSSYSKKNLSCDELKNPYVGIQAGMYFLNQYIDKYGISERAYYTYNTGSHKNGSNKNSRKVWSNYQTWLSKIYGV